MRVADLGCGTADLTLELHTDLRAAQTIGVDSSDSMLAEAARLSAAGLSFVHEDLRRFARQPENQHTFHLAFSNAALQWVPEQARVIELLSGLLEPDGQLAFQVPS